MRALEFITGHVIYNPAYTYKFQLKTTEDTFELVVPDRKNPNQSYGEIPSLETVRGVVILALQVTPTLTHYSVTYV